MYEKGVFYRSEAVGEIRSKFKVINSVTGNFPIQVYS